ncbi:MAG: ATP synthase subunit I [Actinomycetota bacterium]|nr:ATP synthase subunit I [Actinomycetota bacterium]
MSTETPLFVTRDDGPPVERDIANDLIKRGLMVMPALLVIFGITHGVDGVLSSAYGLALVLVNFAFAAFLLTTTARISLSLMMGAVLGGYVVRLALITAAVIGVRNAAWVELVPLGFTIIVAHLGLLLWETKYVSASLAFPGLKPKGSTS